MKLNQNVKTLKFFFTTYNFKQENKTPVNMKHSKIAPVVSDTFFKMQGTD